ncbi:MAG: hydrogenase iron-sulfur subunit [Chloroflexi bacterium]|nr:hydrogenase iron-sulfur subunit [Chloroflexota bacterium]
MIRSSELDPGFLQEVMAIPGGENLLHCWSCGTCAATCLVRRYDPSFNPRLILRKAGIGMRQEVLSSREIWLCSACDACYPRCPQEIHISEVMRAIRTIAIRDGYAPPGPSAEVDSALCSGCAVCTRACPYGAIDRVPVIVDGLERMIAQVDPNTCMACGICVAACPSGSISLEAVRNEELLTRMSAGGWLAGQSQPEGGKPRILAFVCQWSMRSDAEWAEVEAMQDDSLRVVNLPCSGRVDPALVLLALAEGADGVLVVGCGEGECHYKRGTYLGRGKVALLRSVLEQTGIGMERVRFVELEALQRGALPALIADMAAALGQPARVSG